MLNWKFSVKLWHFISIVLLLLFSVLSSLYFGWILGANSQKWHNILVGQAVGDSFVRKIDFIITKLNSSSPTEVSAFIARLNKFGKSINKKHPDILVLDDAMYIFICKDQVNNIDNLIDELREEKMRYHNEFNWKINW
jgi:hypothetical protein